MEFYDLTPLHFAKHKFYGSFSKVTYLKYDKRLCSCILNGVCCAVKWQTFGYFNLIFKFFGWKCILNWRIVDYLMYKQVCQKPVHFLSAQNSVMSSLSQVFIILEIYNFCFLTKERDLRPNHLEQYWPYWKRRQQTVCYVSLKLADRPKMEPKSLLKSHLNIMYC